MKKFLSILLCCLLVFGVVGCRSEKTHTGGGTEDGGNEEPPELEEVEVRDTLEATTLNILLGADQAPADARAVQTAINNELKRSGKPYTVNFEYTSISGYAVTVEDKAKNGFDAAWSHIDNIGDMLSKNVIKTNLMPYIEKWGQQILADVPEYGFAQFTDYRNGGLYAIPRHAPMADDRSRLQVRKDWMDQVGIDEIKTIDQYDNYLTKISTTVGIGMDDANTKKPGFYANPADQANVHLLREICPDFYFPVYGYGVRPIYIDINPSNGKYEVKSFYQTPEFVEWITKCREYVDLGYAPTSVLSGSLEGQFNNGLLGSLGQFSVVKMAERIDNFKLANPTGELYDVFFESEDNLKTVMRGGDNCMVVLANSTHVEEVIDFFNWTKNQKNHDLVCLGVEGVNYFLTDDGRVTFTKNGQTIPANKRYSIYAPYWAYNDLDYMRFSEYLSDEWVEETKNWELNDEDGNPVNYKVSPLIGFNIIQTNEYKTAYNRVSSVSTVVEQLATGREDPERMTTEGITVRQKLVKDITENGIDELIAVVQKQLDDFLASKK